MLQEKCPLCGNSLRQIHRRPLERAISRFYRVHRYICSDADCAWKGLRHSGREKIRRRPTKLWVWVLTILLSLFAGMALVRMIVG